MVAPTTIGARLTQDGILYSNRGTVDSQDADTGFDENIEVGRSGHSITKTNVFADEFDEVTIQNHSASGGSIAFNGTSQRLEVTGSSDFQFGERDFTIEGWFYLTSSAYTRLWCFPNGDNVEVNDGTMYYWNGGGSVTQAGVGTAPTNAWFHVALVKHNNVAKVYLNGVSVISDNSPYNSTTSRPLSIGGEVGSLAPADDPSTQGWLEGKLTNFRVVKGVAVYTSNFNTPYTPSTDTQETVLLLKAVDEAHLITDSSGTGKTVTNIGSATFSSATPLSTVYNGAMKQLSNGTLRVANEINEIEVLS